MPSSGKPLLIISIVLAAISVVVAIYGVAVTVPEIKELRGAAVYNPRYDALVGHTFREALTSWGTGFCAIVFVALAATKGKRSAGWLAALCGLAGAGLAFMLIV